MRGKHQKIKSLLDDEDIYLQKVKKVRTRREPPPPMDQPLSIVDPGRRGRIFRQESLGSRTHARKSGCVGKVRSVRQ